ncbi:MAG: ATP-binding cassette domain-containing protein, partial [Anaerolineales bacterium]
MSEKIIEIRNVSKSFKHVQALSDISLDVNRGEVVFIFGPSGGGKSTLLRCINRLETVDEGEIVVDVPAESLSAAQRSQVEGEEIPLEVDPALRTFELTANPPSVEDLRGDWERVVGIDRADYRG